MRLRLANALATATCLGNVLAAPGANKLKVVKTTTTQHGQVIDWIVPESQGNIATPPSRGPAGVYTRFEKPLSAKALIPDDLALKGPEGTVPIPRPAQVQLPKCSPPLLADDANNSSTSGDLEARQSPHNMHWYADTNQRVANYGGTATLSIFQPYVQSAADFALMQTAVSTSASGKMQTVEAGWVHSPEKGAKPHLFTFYTVNNYEQQGNNVGCWNRDCTGWVQVDNSIFPGMTFSPLSKIGGQQSEIKIGYHYSGGNWWLWVQDRYIGYYPGSLFGAPGQSLNGAGSAISWFGEVYNSEPTVTTTDMGSGNFPDAGLGNAAYMHNINYLDGANVAHPYAGAGFASDASRYNYIPTWNSGTPWGSYMFLGGPGAGGVVGG